MSKIEPTSPPQVKVLGWLGILGLVIGCVCHLLWLASVRPLGLDEFMHSHACWLWDQGQRPYLDFWSQDSGGLWQLLSLAHDVSDSARQFIVRCRQWMCLIWLAQLWLLWRLTTDQLNAKWALFAPLTALMLQPWIDIAVQIRPEPLAWTLLLSALWLVQSANEQNKGIRSALAGSAAVTASWFSLYVGLCGVIWVTLLVGHARVRVKDRPVLVDQALLVCAIVMTSCVWLGFLWSTGLLVACFNSVVMPFMEGRMWAPRTELRGLLAELLWPNCATFVVAALGAISISRRTLKTGVDPVGLFVATVMAMTVASWALSWDASLHMGLGVWILCAICTPLGLRWAWRGQFASGRWSQIAGAAWLIASLTQLALYSEQVPRRELLRQLQTLDQIEELTLSTDFVFASHGQAVGRHTIYPLCSNGWQIRQQLNAKLEHDLISALYKKRVTMAIRPPKDQAFGPRLTRFLKHNFVPYSEDILLSGKAIETRHGGHGKASILVPKQGTWLVEQINPRSPSKVWIDGHQIQSQSLYLRRGLHQVEVQSGAGVWILWQSRDGRRWRPKSHRQGSH